MAALCAIPLSWAHRPRRYRPSKTGFRRRSRHPCRHPPSTGRCRNRRSGDCKRQPSVGQPWPRLLRWPAALSTLSRQRRRLGSIETPTQSVRAFIPKLVYGTRLSVPRHSLRRPAGGWNSRGRIRWSMQPNIGRWQRSSIAWPVCAGHLNPANSACAWRKTSSRLRTARNACMERVRRSMRAISRPSDNPRRIGLSLKGVYALKVGYAETHSCPRPGSATVSFAARAIARRP